MASQPRLEIHVNDRNGFSSQGELGILSLGFGLHLTWIYSAMFGTSRIFETVELFEVGARNVPTEYITLFFLISIFTFTAALIFAGITDQKFIHFYVSRSSMCLASILSTAGTLLLIASHFAGSSEVFLIVIAGLLTGTGSALLILFWGNAFARCSSTSIVVNAIGAVVLATGLYATLIYLIPAPFSMIIVAILPLLELPLLWSRIPESYLTREAAPIFSPLPVPKAPFIIRLAFPMLFLGFTLGAFRSLIMQIIAPSDVLSMHAMVLVAASIIVLILLSVALVTGIHHYWDSLLDLFMPLALFAVCLLPYSVTTSSISAAIVLAAGYMCLEAAMWIFLAQVSHTFRLSAVLIFGIGRGFLSLGSAVGTLSLANPAAVDALTPYGQFGGTLFYIAALIIGLALLPKVRDIKSMIDPRYTNKIRLLEAIQNVNAELDYIVNNDNPSALDALDGNAGASAGASAANAARGASEASEGTVAEDESHRAARPTTSAYPLRTPAGTSAAVRASSGIGSSEKTAPSVSAPAAGAGMVAASDAQLGAQVEQPSSYGSRFDKRSEELANQYLLSSRQAEVFFLLAKGHNAAYIQKKLCITHNTAKSHIYRIYQKLGIHTQQELLAMIEEGMKDED